MVHVAISRVISNRETDKRTSTTVGLTSAKGLLNTSLSKPFFAVYPCYIYLSERMLICRKFLNATPIS